jgi:hypothetical protein
LSSISFFLLFLHLLQQGWLSDIALDYGLEDRVFEYREGLGTFSSPPHPDWL